MHERGDARGLLVDYGGVLTTNVFASFAAFCDEEGLHTEQVRDAFVKDPVGRELLFDFELGRLDEPTFQERLCVVLGLGPERAEGLVDRMFAGMEADETMVAAVGAARAGGVRTGLLSNSWGAGRYDRARFGELFDVLVISGEEGVRKPSPEIYVLGAERLDLPPAACVFVDDLPGNLKPARELGMATVHHRSAAESIAELEGLLGVSLAAGG